MKKTIIVASLWLSTLIAFYYAEKSNFLDCYTILHKTIEYARLDYSEINEVHFQIKYVFICKESRVISVSQEQYYLYQVGEKICFDSYSDIKYLFGILLCYSWAYSLWVFFGYFFR